MRAGLLNEIIQIWRAQQRLNDYGQLITGEFQKVYTTRAQVEKKSGTFTLQNDNTVYICLINFILRGYVPVREYDRIKWGGDFYRILNIIPEPKIQRIRVECELVQD